MTVIQIIIRGFLFEAVEELMLEAEEEHKVGQEELLHFVAKVVLLETH